MPIRIRKLPNKNRWRVYDGSKVVAKSTTKKKAEKQARFLRGLAHGMKPRGQ
ncbi:MAG: hypothetical protein V3U84_12340 [Thiotrichaceae bacterium]